MIKASGANSTKPCKVRQQLPSAERNKWTVSQANMISWVGDQAVMIGSRQKDTRSDGSTVVPVRAAGRKRKMEYERRDYSGKSFKSTSEEAERCAVMAVEKETGIDNNEINCKLKEVLGTDEELETTKTRETDDNERLAPLKLTEDEITVLLKDGKPVANAKVSVFMMRGKDWTSYNKGVTDHQEF